MMKNKQKLVVFGLGTTLVIASAAWAQTAKTLQYKGEIVSHDVRVINGQAYIPLADVARLLSANAVRTGGGYELVASSAGAPAGGANEVKGLHGTVGQMVFTGKWRFEVLSVEHMAEYTTNYQPTNETIKPNGDNDELVVITGLVKNAQAKPHEMVITIHALDDTALTDDQGQSYQPIKFDLTGGGFYGPPSMLPGSSQHFAAIFSIAKGTNLKDLVFSLSSYDDRKLDDVRIALTPSSQ